MAQNSAATNLRQLQAFDVEDSRDDANSKSTHQCYDDDGRLKRTGTVWTASSHIITAVIGSGVLSLAWAVAQLGWIAGPAVMLTFSAITYCTSTLLADCYRAGDPETGKRSSSYSDAVRSILGGVNAKILAIIQYLNLFGIAIGYTIAASISMMSIKRSNCYHSSRGKNPCHMSSTPYILIYGAAECFLSQIPNFDQIWWLSSVAAFMSATYSLIGLALGIVKVAETGVLKGSRTGISVGTVTQAQKIWRTCQALGDIAFAYSFAVVLIEIQDTVKSPPSEAKTMKKATLISTMTTTTFYMLCGLMGYAAFGDTAPGNVLTGFGFDNTYWVIDIAHAAVVIHLVGAYQVYCQPIFAFVEKRASQKWPKVNKEYQFPIPGFSPYNLNLFRIVWRIVFVMITTVISTMLPFFNDIVGVIGAFGFWPVNVYFPVRMYISQKKIAKWSGKWICLQVLSLTCLLVSIVAITGSVAGVFLDLKKFRPFKSDY
ncbi:hypothetical protein K1719_038366 [Acacia pycnantha]|nr:hypothetical protein K1719_038366 [Acacia pycnantha]